MNGTPTALAPFQLIAEGVTAVAGFGVAALSVVRDDGQMQVLAVAGSADAWAQLEGVRTPVDELLSELKLADDWGRFKFVPHERLDLAGENWGWVPDVVPLEGEDAWHPMDLLVAPLRDAAGDLRGTLSIDLPVDGRRPGPEQRRILNAFAEQAERAVLSALEHQVLTEQVRLAETAREIVRTVSGELTMERLVDACNEALVDGFGARGLWIQTFDTAGHPGSGRIWSIAGLEVDLPEELVAIAERAAHDAWRRQAVDVVRVGDPQGQLPPEERHPVDAFLAGLGVTSVLFVPLGAGQECVGNLVLTRGPDDSEWSQVEEAAARDIGRDVGRAILNARTFERERQLVTELKALDSYKTQLIATLSHELKNPLTAIVAHLELLETVALETQERASLDAIDRAARRIDRLVEDLMLLAKVGDPTTPLIARPVDLVAVARDVVDLVSVAAQQGGVSLTIAVSDPSVVALGDSTELDRLVANLVGNAVKYTPSGGAVVVRLSSSRDEVVLECVDTGIGIAPEDQEQLFTEFFRSRNPAALALPGTGLGLAIVARIIARHGGRVVLCSELGSGSTFRVTLPRA